MTARERCVGALAVIASLVAALILGLSLVGCYGGPLNSSVTVYYSYPQYGISGVITKTGSGFHEPGWY